MQRETEEQRNRGGPRVGWKEGIKGAMAERGVEEDRGWTEKNGS
jgi:hypothetical protein